MPPMTMGDHIMNFRLVLICSHDKHFGTGTSTTLYRAGRPTMLLADTIDMATMNGDESALFFLQNQQILVDMIGVPYA